MGIYIADHIYPEIRHIPGIFIATTWIDDWDRCGIFHHQDHQGRGDVFSQPFDGDMNGNNMGWYRGWWVYPLQHIWGSSIDGQASIFGVFMSILLRDKTKWQVIFGSLRLKPLFSESMIFLTHPQLTIANEDLISMEMCSPSISKDNEDALSWLGDFPVRLPSGWGNFLIFMIFRQKSSHLTGIFQFVSK